MSSKCCPTCHTTISRECDYRCAKCAATKGVRHAAHDPMLERPSFEANDDECFGGALGSIASNAATPTEDDESPRLSTFELLALKSIQFPRQQVQIQTYDACDEICCACRKEDRAWQRKTARKQCVKTHCGHFLCIRCITEIRKDITQWFENAEETYAPYGLQRCPACSRPLLQNITGAD